MALFSVDARACLGDGICASVCPKALLRMEGGLPVMDPTREARCNLCGQCLAFCPALAVSLDTDSPGLPVELDPALVIGPDQALQFIRSRRSTRRFRDEPVERAVIGRMLEAARLAPSGGNNHLVRWIVVDGREAVRAMACLVADWFDTSARHDPRHGKRYAIDDILARFRGGDDVILRGAPHLVAAVTPAQAAWGAVDSAIALTCFDLAGNAHGVGACWAGYFIRAAASSVPLRQRLGLGEEEALQGAMVFGVARHAARRIPPRKPQNVAWIG